MPIHFTGFDGYYEIYNASSIIHRRVSSNGVTIYTETYNNIDMIPNEEDKGRISKIIYGNKIDLEDMETSDFL
jgi:hypothetical protein